MTDPLDIIWPSVESPRPRFTADETRAWPPAFFDKLVACGLLVRAESADHVVCPACSEGHIEEVVPRKCRDGRVHLFIRCPEALRVEVPDESVVQWTIDLNALAQAIAGTMSLQGRRMPLIAGRLWRLGRHAWQGASRDIVFARGLHWPDGSGLTGRLGAPGRAIVLVAEQVPPPEFWPGLPHPAVALSGITALTPSGGMELDRALVAAIVEQVDATNRAIQPVALTRRQQNKLFRQEAAAVLKSHLGDDDLINAYLEHGTYRAAAEALSKRGSKISKDAVYRAVRRRGGPDAVRCDHNSTSVRRTVASQRRDRKKKFAAPPETPESE